MFTDSAKPNLHVSYQASEDEENLKESLGVPKNSEKTVAGRRDKENVEKDISY